MILSCLLSTMTLTGPAMSASAPCFDWKGDPVNHGLKFYPTNDPCLMCTCDNGFQIMCKAVACLPPQDSNCKKLEKVKGSCCDYRCLDPPFNNSTNGGTVIEDESISNLGLRLVASTVTSFLVLALLLFVVHRLRQRRLVLAMRRFEIEARRQRLEETDYDHNIPDSFFGIECPPYEDPPPPYSSPKPPPQTLPGEAPPPYEEVDHTQNNRSVAFDNRESSSEGTGSNVVSYENTQTDDRIINQETLNRHSVMTQICQLVLRHHQLKNSGNSTNSERENSNGHLSTSSLDLSSSKVHDVSLDSLQSSGKMAQDECGSTESVQCCSCHCEQTVLKRLHSPEDKDEKEDSCRCKLREEATATQYSNSTSRIALLQKRLSSCKSYPEENNPVSWHSCEKDIADSLETDTLSDNEYDRQNLSPAIFSKSDIPCEEQVRESWIIQRGYLQGMSSKDETTNGKPISSLSNSNKCPAVLTEERLTKIGGQKMLNLAVNENHTPRSESLLNPSWNSNTRSESPESATSTTEKNIVRSQSVHSEISLLSVCSETGEKRASRNASKVLKNDSQYPETSVSTNPYEMAMENNSLESESYSFIDFGDTKSNEYNRRTISNPTELNHTSFESNSRDGKSTKSKLNAIEENGIEMTYYIKREENCQSVTDNVKQNKPAASSKHKSRSKKKDKEKQSHHSVCDQSSPKTKKQLSTYMDLNDVKKHCPVTNGNSSATHVKATTDPARKKLKSGVGSFKQYGFIDDPTHFQSRVAARNNSEQQQHISRQSPRDSRHVTAKECYENHRPLAANKSGIKRLTKADRSSYNPSPTKGKASRPISMVQAPKDKNPGYEDIIQYSVANQNIAHRKSQSCHSKARQSCPEFTGVHCHVEVGSMVKMPCTGKSEEKTFSHPCPNGLTDHSSSDIPSGLITVRNGPLSSYV